ncbi:MAG: hypothetical protein ACETWC_10300 [Acidobacteriota bacterium]
MRDSAFLKTMPIPYSPMSSSGNPFAKKRKRVTLGTALVLTTFLASLLLPQTITPTKPKTIEELSLLSDAIIEGRVVSQRDEAGMTIITLELKKTLKGKEELGCRSCISVRIRGSEEVPVESQVTFKTDQMLLLFLVKTSEPGCYNPYFGGVFVIEDNRIANVGSLIEVEKRIARALSQKPE